MDFLEMLANQVERTNSLACVGLDTDPIKLPAEIQYQATLDATEVWTTNWKMMKFNQKIVDATYDLVCAYKPQFGFYGAQGAIGFQTLVETTEYIHKTYPGIPVILDAKIGDTKDTCEQYAKMVFETIGVDAVTLNPYIGPDGLQPFLAHKDKGCIIMCKTSNPSAATFQDLEVIVEKDPIKIMPLYQVVALSVNRNWNSNKNCLLVVGATYPREAVEIRGIVDDEMTLLVPGLGAQGAPVKAAVQSCLNKQGTGAIFNSSRGIIYASDGPDYAWAAREATMKLMDEINKYR